MNRAGWRCEVEVCEVTRYNYREILLPDTAGRVYRTHDVTELWTRCGAHANDVLLQTAHVYRRTRIGNREAIDDPDVVIAACERHHKDLDQHRTTDVRFPPAAVERARLAVNKYVLPTNRIRDDEEP